MIKAVVFDCFGVLTTDGWKALREEFCTTEELQRHAHDLDVAVNSGFMTEGEFITSVAELFHLDREFVRRAFKTPHTNTALFSFIASTLRADYKIGMLSNAAYNMLNELFTPEQVALFDAVTLSCDLGVVKPDPKMYEDIAVKLAVEPEECVFVDDIERYCVGAREAGMKAVRYDSLVQLQEDVKDLLQ